MKAKVIDLSKTLKNYSDKWIALKPGTLKVIAVGSKLENVINEARRKKIENPILTKAPKDYGTYIL